MNNFIIYSDTACDISQEVLNEWGVKFNSLTFKFDDDDKEYKNFDLSSKEFYDKMRNGGVAKTAAVNIGDFEEVFEEELSNGNDVLYIAFSSGLSTTYNSGWAAAEEIRKKYPERKLIVIDSLCASAGHGLILYMAVQKKNEGASIDEVEKYVLENRDSICHWFTVDDLKYLKRGGRISAASAIAGSVLGIKPVMHVNDEGKLENVLKARGRKAALRELANKYGETALDVENGLIFISHADCADDVAELEKMFQESYGASFDHVTNIGPVVGAHSGPGTLALFFAGKER